MISIHHVIDTDSICRNYNLTAEGVCYRTQVAVRAMTLQPRDWKKFLKGHTQREEARDSSRADAFIAVNVLRTYKGDAMRALEALATIEDRDLESQKEILVKRWTQIRDIIEKAEENSIGPWTRDDIDTQEGFE